MGGAVTDNSNVWIVTTPSTRPDPASRKLIRRHVMRNKNTRDHQQAAKIRSLMRQYEAQWLQQQASRPPPGAFADEKDWIPKVPHQVASELATFNFGFELKSYMVDLIYRAFTVIKPSVYNIEKDLVGKEQDRLFCFDNLSQHPALIHAVMYTSQSFYESPDGNNGNGLSRIARYHLGESLRHLQLALDDDVEARTNSTMATVVSLATAAAFLGDMDSLIMHMDGLCRMVAFRGGLDSLGTGSMIEHKAQRLDFGLSLATGSPTRLFRDVSHWGPHIALDGATQCPELNMLRPRPDEKLMNTWADLREFSRAANQTTRTGVKMSPGFFCLFADTVPYRLATLRFDPASNSELLRLLMLAYTKDLLTQIKGMGKRMVYLHSNLKAAILKHHCLAGPESARFWFWALSVATLAVFEDFDREWIRELAVVCAGHLEIKSWESARAVLKSFLWTDLVHDLEGEQLMRQWLGQPQ